MWRLQQNLGCGKEQACWAAFGPNTTECLEEGLGEGWKKVRERRKLGRARVRVRVCACAHVQVGQEHMNKLGDWSVGLSRFGRRVSAVVLLETKVGSVCLQNGKVWVFGASVRVFSQYLFNLEFRCGSEWVDNLGIHQLGVPHVVEASSEKLLKKF